LKGESMVTSNNNGKGTPVDTDLERMELEHQALLRAKHKRDVDKIRDVVYDKVVDRITAGVESTMAVEATTKACKLCGQQTLGSVGAAGIKWSFICPPCKRQVDGEALARTMASVRMLEDPEPFDEFTGPMPAPAKPRRMGDHIEMQYDAGGISMPIAVEYEWEDVYSRDGDRVIGAKRTPVKVQMFPENETTQFICEQIPLDDDQIFARFEEEDRKCPREEGE
jgi:hypothetical protein